MGALGNTRMAAEALGVKLLTLELRGPNPDLEGAFRTATSERVGALLVAAGPAGLPGGTPLRRALTKKGAEQLIASFLRFVYVAGWPWRAVRRALRKARWSP